MVGSSIGSFCPCGVAILNGLVLVTFMKQKLEAGAPLEQAVREGCLVRLRPTNPASRLPVPVTAAVLGRKPPTIFRKLPGAELGRVAIGSLP
jgi:Cu/Ag efflux pump CusA